jgi:2-dehydropantoate 2-reductase
MRVAVVGAGAVGGAFGGLLAIAGQDVSFIARGAHLRAIQDHGLRLEGSQGRQTVSVPATDRPEELDPVDLVIVAVKSYDTPDAARIARPLLRQGTAVLSLQNGVENEDVISSVIGKEHVLGGIAYIGSRVSSPGTIVHELRGRIVLGEMDGRITPRVREVQALFDGAQIPCRISEDIRSDKWDKLVGNSVVNVIPAITGCRVGDLVGDGCRDRALRAALEEVIAVGRALGHPIPERSLEGHIRFCRKYPDFETSTQQDVRRGRRLETEALSGVVVRKGKEVGVPTPVHSTLYRLLRARGGSPGLGLPRSIRRG